MTRDKKGKLLPINKRWPGKPCIRAELYRNPQNGGGYGSKIGFECSITSTLSDVILFAAMNPSGLTDELLEAFVAECKARREEHSDHFP